MLEAPANIQRHEKETKGIQIGKEEIKLSVLTGDMIACVENPKSSGTTTPRDRPPTCVPCEASRANTMTGGPDLSFGFPRNGKIPYPHQATWSQPINMRPVRNKGTLSRES